MNNNINFNVITKKKALENKLNCCAVKKKGNNIGSISYDLNVSGNDYLFIEYTNKNAFINKINNIQFNQSKTLNKTLLENLYY